MDYIKKILDIAKSLLNIKKECKLTHTKSNELL